MVTPKTEIIFILEVLTIFDYLVITIRDGGYKTVKH